MPASKRLTPEEQEQAIIRCHKKELTDNRLKNYEVPDSKKAIVAALPKYFLELRRHGSKMLNDFGYPTPKFTPEQLALELETLFVKSAEIGVPVNVSSIASWLGVTRDTLNEWQQDPSNALSAIIKRAKEDVTAQRIMNGETGATQPIFSMFILKAMHGFVETSNINLSAQANAARPENISEDDFERQGQMLLDKGVIKP